MRLAVVADVYPPLRSSGAVQLRDLTRAMAAQGHAVTMFVSAPEQSESWRLNDVQGVQVLRLATPRTRDMGYARRSLAEWWMSYAMRRGWQASPLADERFDGVVWYSPSIFHAPLVRALMAISGCPGYLIVRDIFPEWARDMGLMGDGIPYRMFKHIAHRQYEAADVIGVQTPGNLPYFADWQRRHPERRVEVLHNWLAPAANVGCPIDVAAAGLAGRTIFVYAGNMGVAQGMDVLLDLAEQFKTREDIGFVFVGRGSDTARLRADAEARDLSAVRFFDEIEPEHIAGLYAQCHIGLVVLDPRHQTHNIPGKFLSYMQAGMPVLASVNAGNDLLQLINDEEVGIAASSAGSVDGLVQAAITLVQTVRCGTNYRPRCARLAQRLFDPLVAVTQIVAALTHGRGAQAGDVTP
ncbi:MAG: glycosyltransferase family 4 protein [Proteobacteria bacterium]|nr:glycosyltransferase family 4 protein [Pseudomonadota bacterium]